MHNAKENRKRPGDIISRRQFLGTTAAATAFTIIPRHVLGGPGYVPPSDKIKRVPNGLAGIYADFINAIKSGEPACSNFNVSGPLTEVVLLGNLAVRMNLAYNNDRGLKGQRLLWDGEKMEVTNLSEVNKFVKREYREGWSL